VVKDGGEQDTSGESPESLLTSIDGHSTAPVRWEMDYCRKSEEGEERAERKANDNDRKRAHGE